MEGHAAVHTLQMGNVSNSTISPIVEEKGHCTLRGREKREQTGPTQVKSSVPDRKKRETLFKAEGLKQYHHSGVPFQVFVSTS